MFRKARGTVDEILAAAKDAFENEDTERRREVFNEVEREKPESRDPDQVPMHEKMFGQHMVGTTIRDAMGWSDPDHKAAREAAGFDSGSNWKETVGKAAGRAGADFAKDNSRNIYWYVNAIQAATNLINDAVVSKVRPDVRGYSPVTTPDGTRVRVDENNPDQAFNVGATTKSGKPKPGYRVKTEYVDLGNGKRKKNQYYEQTNTQPIIPSLLGLPASLAVNSSLGLLNPFGGQEGYQAVVPSEDDPRKTANIISEVGQKYIMGRTGNLLPWDEFKVVRPDVSKEEYANYKRFKYEKGLDVNPFDDGEVTLPGGVVKYTNEGIHGPELQYLGRSMPLTTGITPLAAAIGGVAAGLSTVDQLPDYKDRTSDDIAKYRKQVTRRGIGGGLAGFTIGSIGGTLIEDERRARNMRENLPKTNVLDPETGIALL